MKAYLHSLLASTVEECTPSIGVASPDSNLTLKRHLSNSNTCEVVYELIFERIQNAPLSTFHNIFALGVQILKNNLFYRSPTQRGILKLQKSCFSLSKARADILTTEEKQSLQYLGCILERLSSLKVPIMSSSSSTQTGVEGFVDLPLPEQQEEPVINHDNHIQKKILQQRITPLVTETKLNVPASAINTPTSKCLSVPSSHVDQNIEPVIKSKLREERDLFESTRRHPLFQFRFYEEQSPLDLPDSVVSKLMAVLLVPSSPSFQSCSKFFIKVHWSFPLVQHAHCS